MENNLQSQGTLDILDTQGTLDILGILCMDDRKLCKVYFLEKWSLGNYQRPCIPQYRSREASQSKIHLYHRRTFLPETLSKCHLSQIDIELLNSLLTNIQIEDYSFG